MPPPHEVPLGPADLGSVPALWEALDRTERELDRAESSYRAAFACSIGFATLRSMSFGVVGCFDPASFGTCDGDNFNTALVAAKTV